MNFFRTAKKSLGQNFLIDQNIINKIIEDDPSNAEALTTRAMLNFIYQNAGVGYDFGEISIN